MMNQPDLFRMHKYDHGMPFIRSIQMHSDITKVVYSGPDSLEAELRRSRARDLVFLTLSKTNFFAVDYLHLTFRLFAAGKECQRIYLRPVYLRPESRNLSGNLCDYDAQLHFEIC